MQGMGRKKKEALGAREEVRSSGGSGGGGVQGRAQRRMGQCGRGSPTASPRTTSRLLGVNVYRVEFTGLCNVRWYLISVARMLLPRGISDDGSGVVVRMCTKEPHPPALIIRKK